MQPSRYLLVTLLVIFSVIFSVMLLPSVYATPTVKILIDKTTFRYCEKLSYTVQVSEITEKSAIMHIRDQLGKKSSAIPIPISNLQNKITSPFAFEADIFQIGKYFIDIEYAGAKDTTEFNLTNTENACIPQVMKQIAYNWVSDKITDGFFIDSINKYVDKKIITIPDKIKEKNLDTIHIPKWVKNIVTWWLVDKISEKQFSEAIQYLINNKIIVI